MLLTITSTTAPARDLGFMLRKHPDRAQTFGLPFGTAHVWYPQATDDRTTMALHVDVDPVALVRSRRLGGAATDHVNDRPYVASSFLSVTLARVLGTALRADADDEHDHVRSLETTVAVVSSPGGSTTVEELFAPLGYAVAVTTHPLDPAIPTWGDSPYLTVTLACDGTVGDLLRHLYVLLPALDGDKHYWIDDSEVDKLLRAGEGWLGDHPQRQLITRRYLKGQRSLTTAALDRLLADEPDLAAGADEPHAAAGPADADQGAPGPMSTPLHVQRRRAVVRELLARGARRILDLGCGEGRLVADLLREPTVAHVTGVDVSTTVLRRAAERLHLDELSHRQRDRVSLLQSALTYRDGRLRGFDAAAVVEVIEHLDPWRLDAFAAVVFGDARPGTVVVTTPNAEHNVTYGDIGPGGHRHADHRFEWTRDQFAGWSADVASTHGYDVAVKAVGEELSDVGAPTQLAVFTVAGDRS